MTSFTRCPRRSGRRAAPGRRSAPAPAGLASTASSAPRRTASPAGGDVVRPSADRRVDDVDAGGARAAMASAVRGLPVVCMTRTAPGGMADDQVAVQADLLDLFVGEHAEDDQVGAVADLGQIGRPHAHRVRAQRCASRRTSSARTSWPASTRRRTMGAPMRPAPTKPTRVIADGPSTSAPRRRRRTPHLRAPTHARPGSPRGGHPSAAMPRRSRRVGPGSRRTSRCCRAPCWWRIRR